MALRKMSATMWTVKKARIRKNNPPRPVDALPTPLPTDLLDFLEQTLSRLGDRLVDHKKQRYAKVQSFYRASGHPRVLVAEFELGDFGEEGKVRDTNTHKVAYVNKKSEVHTETIRLVFVVPQGARAAVMFSETVHRRSVSSRIVAEIRHAWTSLDVTNDWTLKSETQVMNDAWLKAVSMSQVEVTSHAHVADHVPPGHSKVIGTMNYSFVPAKGKGYFPTWMLAALRTAGKGGSLKDVPEILGLDNVGGEDVDQVRIVVSDGDREKGFYLGHEKTPTIQWELTDAEGNISAPNALVSRCIAECPGLFHHHNLQWHAV